ncbi:SLC2A4 [Cordylochernes scorpioides]|uniref:SLC2A4 n=1 Tax=Cordylochernes scorpioides TaxID=51811 RepID=A0ABY6L1N7_9ARAC|nr:SLC2A4 [Cordylochernes scorpioides]
MQRTSCGYLHSLVGLEFCKDQGVIEDIGMTRKMLFAILAAFLGMVQFGYNTGVINAPERVKFINITSSTPDEPTPEGHVTLIYSIMTSIFAIGGMIGAFCAGKVADSLGRKKGLLINNIFGVLGGILMETSKSASTYYLLIFGRFIIGINCGANTVFVPLYLSEIAPVTLRGGLGTVNQLGVTIGLLVSQILGLEPVLGSDWGWSWLLGMAVVPSLLQLVALPWCPESPRFLLISRRLEDQAVASLKWLRGGEEPQIKEELEEMKHEAEADSKESKMTVLQVLRNRMLWAPLAIGVMMHLSQQLTGINAVFYYSTIIFTGAGLDKQHATLATMGVGIIMVTMTFITIPLMDRLGRRALHLGGLLGMLVFSVLLTVTFNLQDQAVWLSYISVAATLLFVMFFAIGPGTIPLLIMPELFSQGPRPAAISIGVVVNWLANFTVALCYPNMQVLQSYIYLHIRLSHLLLLFLIPLCKDYTNSMSSCSSSCFMMSNGLSQRSCLVHLIASQNVFWSCRYQATSHLLHAYIYVIIQ